MKKNDGWRQATACRRGIPRTMPLLCAFLAGALPPGLARAEFALNLQAPATVIARQIVDLHTTILWICGVILVVVFLPLVYALIRFRRSRGAQASQFHDNTPLEIVWTIIPAVILVAMAWPATETVLAMKDTSASDMTIKVTGHQWKWEYEYLARDGTPESDEPVRFFSNLATPREQIENQAAKGEHYLLEVDNPLVVPTGKKIRLVLTAADVIHSWWVPAFGVKQDAFPGFIRDTWFKVDEPGVYRGQCAELCGVNHGYMPVVVKAVPPAEFDAWLASQKQLHAAARAAATRTYALADLKAQGEKVYATNCAACHQPTGKGIPGAFPALDGSKVATGPVEGHLDVVLHGRPGTAMQAFGKQLSDLEIAAVLTYERNSWSNRAGAAVQPTDVAAARAKDAAGGAGMAQAPAGK